MDQVSTDLAQLAREVLDRAAEQYKIASERFLADPEAFAGWLHARSALEAAQRELERITGADSAR